MDLLVVHGPVVEARNVHLVGELVLDGVGPVVEGRGGGARGIFLVEEPVRRWASARPSGLRLFGDLVADAPHDDARVVAVAVHHVAHVALATTRRSTCCSRCGVLGMRHMSKASSITTRPRRSQNSSSSGEGGLWLVRMALTPAAFQDLELALGGPAVDGRCPARPGRDDRRRPGASRAGRSAGSPSAGRRRGCGCRTAWCSGPPRGDRRRTSLTSV